MNILVYSLNEKDINQNQPSTKVAQTICPKCGENAKIKFKDYLITICGCKNNHITENILLEEYQNTQIIDENIIVYDVCKKGNKEKSLKKLFYFCGTCSKNIYLICKDYHNKNHFIINYELKNYTCLEHGDNYYAYCQKCKKNICIACEDNHLDHKIITFGKLLPKKENLNYIINEMKTKIDRFKEEVNKLKKILDYVIENIYNYYNIIINI